ncbi:hypothetical protein HGRIS_010849 [Hohenbuehelia grisea]|uniref:Ubiquitin-like domain-containing protein n=1 Tax=Hohenbuehelia grisea TaxID=104357 RepID=A0ABR3IY19_9AGAR
MAFQASSNFAVYHSTFNDVGGDQINRTSYHFHAHPHSIHHGRPLTGTESSPLTNHAPRTDQAEPYASLLALIADIQQLLFPVSALADDHLFGNLQLDLAYLFHVLCFSGQAMKVICSTPLRNLHVVEQLTTTVSLYSSRLNDMLVDIRRYRDALRGTVFGPWWLRIVSFIIFTATGPSATNLVSDMREKLLELGRPLQRFLALLLSDAWLRLYSHSSPWNVHAFQDFVRSLAIELPALRAVQIHTLPVLDHLGQYIPVALDFCHLWGDFLHIIYVHCKNRPGSQFIKQGDFQLIRSNGSLFVPETELSNVIKDQAMLEISIILRKAAQFRDQKNTCPSCQYVSINTVVYKGWMECWNCGTRFQVAVARLSIGGRKMESKDDSRTNHRLRRGSMFSRNNETTPSRLPRATMKKAQHPLPKQAPKSSQSSVDPGVKERKDNDNETRLFRRVSVICTETSLGGMRRKANTGWLEAPEALPGTSTTILQPIWQWADDKSAPPILWMTGSSGTGKSAIIKSVRLFAYRQGIGMAPRLEALFQRIGTARSEAFPALTRQLLQALKEVETFRAFPMVMAFEFREYLTPEDKVCLRQVLEEALHTRSFKLVVASAPDFRVDSVLSPMVEAGMVETLDLDAALRDPATRRECWWLN